jgi:thousand and one amino acid protein kinase
MAPEVIMAMDEGQYDGKVDIWSIGITCIEMAERKPPLFHMNAMAAMYHIAQKDPPTLQRPQEWSEIFRDFIASCLKKEPEDRMSSTEALEHMFINTPKQEDTMFKLIQRTKEAVRQVDHQNFKRLQKMLMGDDSEMVEDIEIEPSSDIDPTGEDVMGSTPSLSTPSPTPTQDDDDISIGDVSGSSLPQRQEDIGSESPQRPFRQHAKTTSGVLVRSDQTGELISHSNLLRTGSIASASASITPTSPMEPLFTLEPETMEPKHSKMAPDEVARRVAGHSDGFSTLRPHSLISKQAEEHQLQSDLKEQMQGYKRIRAQHKGQMAQLEVKHRNEMGTLIKAQERELEQLRSTYERDMDRLRQSHKTEIERRHKQECSDDRKFQRSIKERQEQDMKQFVSQQKGDYRATKNLFKKVHTSCLYSIAQVYQWL